MQIRFSLSRLDLFRARAAVLLCSRALWALWGGIGALVFYSAFTTELKEPHGTGFRLTLAAVETVVVLGFSIGFAMAFTLFQTFAGKGRGVLGEHTLRLTDEGLEETTEYNVSLHRWSGFGKCRERGGFFFIYVTDTMAHVVPLRRPLLEGDLAEFRRALEPKLPPR
jgi:hypothetical protein